MAANDVLTLDRDFSVRQTRPLSVPYPADITVLTASDYFVATQFDGVLRISGSATSQAMAGSYPGQTFDPITGNLQAAENLTDELRVLRQGQLQPEVLHRFAGTATCVKLFDDRVGTEADDRIDLDSRIRRGREQLRVRISSDSAHAQDFQYATDEFDSVLVYLLGGDDRVDIANDVRAPLTVHADAGNDRVRAGPGPAELFGGDGSDLVMGEGGKDILPGGDGSDLVFGGDGRDLLIGGAGSDLASGEKE